jgi:hypothetical protein
MDTKEKKNGFFAKLPFKAMAEKIPAETREKIPLLNKAIPFANQIAVGALVFLALVIIACSGGGKSGSSGASSGGGSSSSGNSASIADDVKSAAGDVKGALAQVADKAKKATGSTSSSKPASNAKATKEDAFEVELTNNNTVRIKRYIGKDKQVVIPATIQGMPVTDIGIMSREGGTSSGVFSEGLIGGLGLTSVVIPEGVTLIGEDAFDGCTKLTSVTLPSTLTAIGEGAFRNCGMKKIVIPDSVTKFGDRAFQYASLEEVTLPKGLKVIPVGMFEGAKFVTLNIPEGVEYICDDAFRECTKLTNVTLPSTIKKFGGTYHGMASGSGYGPFAECENLTKVTVPDKCYKI